MGVRRDWVSRFIDETFEATSGSSAGRIDTALVVSFRHLHPADTSLRANGRIKKATRAGSDLTESDRPLYLLVLLHFLSMNRYPLHRKMP